MGCRSKIKRVDELAAELSRVRDGRKVVHCHGVFDLLHIGHIRHFERAKELGDILVVTVTPDRYVNKGPHRPMFDEELRAEGVAALDCVDYVAINQWPTAVEIIDVVKPDYYVKGSEYSDADRDVTGGITRERAAVEAAGGQVAYTNDVTFSSSNLINRYLPVFPTETRRYLETFGRKYSVGDVTKYLESAQGLRVLVVGETIIDEYEYCETIGKSGKEPVLAARHVHSERFAGGVLAVANHVAAFTDHVGLLTLVGRDCPYERLITDRLDPKIERTFVYMESASTIVKRRFVETYPFQKLFELYLMGETDEGGAEAAEVCRRLIDLLPRYDVVIATDYGHGLLTAAATEILCKGARFLAVNTQANAANHGFNTVSKYRHADYICVSENEIRLEVRSRRRNLRDVIVDVAERLSCGRVLVTRGQQGTLGYDHREGFVETPALAVRVVDRVGAGDAVFGITALCVVQGAPMDMVGFIGNAVGAEAVATVGHRQRVERPTLVKHMQSLLK